MKEVRSFINNTLLLGAVIVIGSARISEFSRCPAMLAVRMSLRQEYNSPVVGEGEAGSGVQKYLNHRTLLVTPSSEI